MCVCVWVNIRAEYVALNTEKESEHSGNRKTIACGASFHDGVL